ncbi:GspH/FimT family pseudopilin [Bacterioplanoides sp.]|uniref:GspH/FimT family pseudopilin n=1 Tax=Bacterioplanoides sp. TaxID=2066072 RepID=UPI003B00CF28
MQQAKGFTLVELIMVLVILGIVSTFAASRFADRQSYSGRAIVNQLLASARLAQQTAFAQSSASNVQMQVNRSGDQWNFQVLGGDGLNILLDAGNEQIRFGTNLSAACSALSNASLTLSFNGQGSLVSGQNTRICVVDDNRSREICISSAGYAYEGNCVL